MFFKTVINITFISEQFILCCHKKSRNWQGNTTQNVILFKYFFVNCFIPILERCGMYKNKYKCINSYIMTNNQSIRTLNVL